MKHRFVKSESGAITVDYVVLSWGATVAGVLMMSTIGPSLADIANKVVAALEATVGSITQGDTIVNFNHAYDFSDGAPGWNGATPTAVQGFGDVLGPIPGSSGLESVTNSFNIGPNNTSATLTFDLLAFDSLDGEDAIIFIGGEAVGSMTSLGGQLTWNPGNVDGITIEADIIASGEPIGGMQTGSQWWWNDGIATISVTVENPGETLDFGMGSNADQGINDESWGLDNFVITATGPGATVGTDPGS